MCELQPAFLAGMQSVQVHHPWPSRSATGPPLHHGPVAATPPEPRAGPVLWARCWGRIRTWRVPPRWSVDGLARRGPRPGGARRLPGPPRVLRLGRVDGTNELGPGLRLKGEETGSSFQSWRASVPAAHGTPRGGNSSRPPGTSGPDPETPCSSPRVSAPPSRSDERHGADEDRAGDHPARGGSSDWRSLRKSSRALSSRNSLKSSCFASLIKPFSTAF